MVAGAPQRLVDRLPAWRPARLVAELAPPPRFAAVRLNTYRPDPAQPSQAAALDAVTAFIGEVEGTGSSRGRGGRLGRRRLHAGGPAAGLYLDGGFGVGKTHLLASAWHAAPPPKAFCTFVELTHLVGALGFGSATEALGVNRLLCIDEFELDDPGDTVLVSTLVSTLVERRVRIAATSNTLPDRLGEGRFAAADFLREIQTLAQHFRVVRIEGEDYRHRGLPVAPPPLEIATLRDSAQRMGSRASEDDFSGLLAHLSRLHPSSYGHLLDGIEAVLWTGVRPLNDQVEALRLVVLADRLYDREVPVLAEGAALDQLFSQAMLSGGYRGKYRRAASRLIALAHEGRALVRRWSGGPGPGAGA